MPRNKKRRQLTRNRRRLVALRELLAPGYSSGQFYSFFPIIRTYAPFMAGVGRMRWLRFFSFSVLGTAAWITVGIGAGYFLGSFAFVQKHFEVIVIVIILVTLSPTIIHSITSRRAAKRAAASPAGQDAPAE